MKQITAVSKKYTYAKTQTITCVKNKITQIASDLPREDQRAMFGA